MPRLTRAKALQAMTAAGARGDKAAFTRLVVENRVSLQKANEAWRKGVGFARFVTERDAAKERAQ